MKLPWFYILFTFIAMNCIMPNRIQCGNWYNLAIAHSSAGQNTEIKQLSDMNEEEIFLKIDRIVSNGDPNALRKLIADGLPINVRNKYKWTPLMIAVRARKMEMVKFLIDNGADLNIQGESGLTPLM